MLRSVPVAPLARTSRTAPEGLVETQTVSKGRIDFNDPVLGRDYHNLANEMKRYLLLDFEFTDTDTEKRKIFRELGNGAEYYHILFLPPAERYVSITRLSELNVVLTGLLMFVAFAFVFYDVNTTVHKDSLFVNSPNALPIMQGIIPCFGVLTVFIAIIVSISSLMVVVCADMHMECSMLLLHHRNCLVHIGLTALGMVACFMNLIFLCLLYLLVNLHWIQAIVTVSLIIMVALVLYPICVMRNFVCPNNPHFSIHMGLSMKWNFLPAYFGKGKMFTRFLSGELELRARSKSLKLLQNVIPGSDMDQILTTFTNLHVKLREETQKNASESAGET